MSYPKEGADLIGIVVGGGDDDVTDMSGTCRVFIPSLHSDDVLREHLPKVTRLGSGGNEGLCFSGGPPEDGTMVVIRKNTGHSATGFGYIVGVVKDDTNTKQEVPGNMSIRGFKAVRDALARKHKINSKAKAGSGEAGSKPTENSGEKYYHDLLKGIPNSATLWPIAGMKLPQVRGIATATQSFNSIIPTSALASLPGMSLSLGNLFSNMPPAIMSELMTKLPEEVGQALTTMTNLIPESSPDGLEGIRVNTDIFYANALNLLSQCRSTDDIVLAISTLLSDTTLHGTDTLPNITLKVDTPFGEIDMSFDLNGVGLELVDDQVMSLVNQFNSLLNDTSGGFPGISMDKNMWGGSSAIMGDMMKRLSSNEYKTAIDMAKNSIASGSDSRSKINERRRKAEGSDFLA